MQSTHAAAPQARSFSKSNPDDVHAKLVQLAGTQSTLDVEIGEWLLAADRLDLHEAWGFTSFDAYALAMFGWDGRAVRDRIRVAASLEKLPLVRGRMLDGKMNWSVAREITRIPESPDVEREWVEKTEGLNARQVARMVKGLDKDARPFSKKNPDLVTYTRVFEFNGEELAILEGFLRDVRSKADGSITESQALISGITNKQAQAGMSGSRHQVAFVKRVGDELVYASTTEGPALIAPEVAERIECDTWTVPATVDGKIVEKAAQSIPPAHRRQVLLESGGMCETACGSCLYDIHHSKFRKDGGGHAVKFLIGLCWWCHRRVHEGFLRIEGDRESGYRFFQANGKPFGSLRGTPSTLLAIADAVQGLNRLGCKDPESRRLAEDAARELAAEKKSITGEAVFERALRARGRAYKMKPTAAAPASAPAAATMAHARQAEASATSNSSSAHVRQADGKPVSATNDTAAAHVRQADGKPVSATNDTATAHVRQAEGEPASATSNMGVAHVRHGEGKSAPQSTDDRLAHVRHANGDGTPPTIDAGPAAAFTYASSKHASELAHVRQSKPSPGAPNAGSASTRVGELAGDAISGMRNLGCRESDARSYVELALATLGEAPSLEAVLAQALRLRGQTMLAREGSGGGESKTGTDTVEFHVRSVFRSAIDEAAAILLQIRAGGPDADAMRRATTLVNSRV